MSETTSTVAARLGDVGDTRFARRGLLFWVCAGWLAFVVMLALLAGVLPLADPLKTLDGPPRTGPSWENLLGTDALGRDLLARVAYGARVSLVVGLGATAVAVLIGGILGTLAGYCRGWVDTVVTTVVDAMLAFPSLVVALLVVTFVGPSMMTVTVVLGVLSAPSAARLVRGSTIAIRDREFVVASQVLGARPPRTIRRDIVPNILRPVISFAFLLVGVVIVAEGSLAFLGLSVRPPTPTWGGMIEEGRISLDMSVWASLVPAAAMVLTVLALNWLHDVTLTSGSRRARPAAPVEISASGSDPAPVKVQETADTAPVEDGVAAVGPEAPEGTALCLQEMRTIFSTPDGPLRAVDGVSVHVMPGRTLGIVGESGSGKSVLIRSFLRIVGDGVAESGGRAWFGGTDVTGLSDAEFAEFTRGQIGLIVQDTSTALNPVRTIGSQMRELLRFQLGIGRREADERAHGLLVDVGMTDPARRLTQYPHQLSGGMRQRVLIAMALVGEPSLLLADEPTTALDVTVQHQVLELLRNLRDDRGAAMVLISHDLPLVAHWADDVAVMYRGKVVESGPAEDVLSHPRMWYTRALLDAVPDPFNGVDQLAAIDGQPALPVGEEPGCVFASRCPAATERCLAESPPMLSSTPGAAHRYGCWHPLGTDDRDLLGTSRREED